jgi:aminoglycoside phosphotransferase (APT) family kinase protein
VENVEDRVSAMVESSRNTVSVARDESEIADRLARLAGHWFEPGAKLIALERLSGGASQELWSFDVDARGSLRPLILRCNPGGAVRRDMVAGMETEARLIRLAEQAGAPVPRVVHVLSPEEGLGSGFIMERIEGGTSPRKLVLRNSSAVEPDPMASGVLEKNGTPFSIRAIFTFCA